MSSSDEESNNWVSIALGVLLAFALLIIIGLAFNQYNQNQQINDSIDSVNESIDTYNESLNSINDSIEESNTQTPTETTPPTTEN